jgi:septal ring factor EnvC (AmiA/AmiB activator)
LRQGLINQDAYEKVVSILRLREKLDGTKLRLAQVEQSRQRVYKAQEQIQGNMKALDREGKEGQMRESYLEKLSATETELASLASQEAQLEQERTQIEKQIEQQLEELK